MRDANRQVTNTMSPEVGRAVLEGLVPVSSIRQGMGEQGSIRPAVQADAGRSMGKPQWQAASQGGLPIRRQLTDNAPAQDPAEDDTVMINITEIVEDFERTAKDPQPPQRFGVKQWVEPAGAVPEGDAL